MASDEESTQRHVDRLTKAIKEKNDGEHIASLQEEHLKVARKKLEEAKTAKAKSTASDHPQTIVPQPPQKTAKKKVSVVRTKPPLPEFIDDLDQCLLTKETVDFRGETIRPSLKTVAKALGISVGSKRLAELRDEIRPKWLKVVEEREAEAKAAKVKAEMAHKAADKKRRRHAAKAKAEEEEKKKKEATVVIDDDAPVLVPGTPATKETSTTDKFEVLKLAQDEAKLELLKLAQRTEIHQQRTEISKNSVFCLVGDLAKSVQTVKVQMDDIEKDNLVRDRRVDLVGHRVDLNENGIADLNKGFEILKNTVRKSRNEAKYAISVSSRKSGDDNATKPTARLTKSLSPIAPLTLTLTPVKSVTWKLPDENESNDGRESPMLVEIPRKEENISDDEKSTGSKSDDEEINDEASNSGSPGSDKFHSPENETGKKDQNNFGDFTFETPAKPNFFQRLLTPTPSKPTHREGNKECQCERCRYCTDELGCLCHACRYRNNGSPKRMHKDAPWDKDAP